MNADRLQIWIDALEDRERNNRHFSLDQWLFSSPDNPCGFVGCAVGDLALYLPAQKLGWRIVHGRIPVFRGTPSPDVGGPVGSILDFLEVEGEDEWVLDTIMPGRAKETYREESQYVTRKMVMDRLYKKLRALTGGEVASPAG